MQNSIKVYEENWNELSWEMSAAADAFFAMAAFCSWSQELIARLRRKEEVPMSPFANVIAVMSNATCAYFFIAACRIREEKRSTLNLAQLFLTAKELGLLKPEEEEAMNRLLSKTEKTFRKIKKARGMGVAHLQQRSNPLIILQTEWISKNELLSYLQDCSEAFSVLGRAR